ncbi:MAG: TPM domain-containing protein [Candidatus Paceibacterota bacterium]
MRIIVFLASIMLATSIFAKDVPEPSGHVTDLAKMLKTNQEAELEELLLSYKKTTSNEIAVLIIDSLEGEVLEQYSVKVAQQWGVGKKEKDNGVLLLISKRDRKIRIEVGYGLEGTLTDVLSGRIVDGEITPEFKDGNFYEGIKSGVDMIIKVIDGEYTEENVQEEISSDVNLLVLGACAFVIALIGAFQWIAGGISGGIIGGFIFWILFGPGFIILGVILGAIVGVIGGFILRIIAESEGGGSSSSGSYSSGYSSSSNSSFGGGSFGGGGASGSW